MHTKVKSLLLAFLFVLSLASFLYINFCPSAQIVDATNLSGILSAESTDYNAIIPELEILEWFIDKVTPIIR